MKICKRIFAFITMLVLCISLAGCARRETENMSNTSMFVVVEQSDAYYVVYQKNTKVMYVVSDGVYNRGNFTILLNNDGTPMIWGGERWIS